MLNEQAKALLKELGQRKIMTPKEINKFLNHDGTADIVKVMGETFDELWDEKLESALLHPLIKQLERRGYIGRSETLGEVPNLPICAYGKRVRLFSVSLTLPKRYKEGLCRHSKK